MGASSFVLLGNFASLRQSCAHILYLCSVFSVMQAHTAGVVKPKATEILAPPPRSGSFSVYAQKLTALAFVWLCCIVVWGNVANLATARGICILRCRLQITFSVITWIYSSFLLVLNYLTEASTLSRTGCFSHGLEAQFTAFMIILWIPVLATTSSNNYENVATWFSWLGFFGSIYASYKAYHSFKEEDLPSSLPEGFNEEDYVYG